MLAYLAGTYPSVHAADDDTHKESEQTKSLSEQEQKDLLKLAPETIVIKAHRLASGDETTSLTETLDVSESDSRFQSVTQVIDDSVGVRVRTLGGLGSYGAASIRGSAPNQVPVYLDGILLNAGGFDTVDLGDLSLDLFERINIYRSGAPTSLGTVGIGGAIQLNTRTIAQALWQGAMSAGSNNTYRLMALGSSRLGSAASFLALASVSGSSGDFLYYDDMGTRFNAEDDLIRPRSNNDHKEFSALLKVHTKAGAWNWDLLENFFFKTQGVAGMQSSMTRYATLQTSRNATSVQTSYSSENGWSLRPEINYLYLTENMNDSHGAHGELGMGRQHTSTTTHALSCGVTFQMEEAQGHFSTLRTDFRYERMNQVDMLNDMDMGTRQRLRGALAAQHQWTIASRLSLLPSGRIEFLQSSFGEGNAPGLVAPLPEKSTTEALWQLALGAKWDIVKNISFVTNVGRYVRAPTLGELFGYRGTVVGNPDLDSETGIKSDMGLLFSVDKIGPLHHAKLQVAGFASWTRNLIAYWQNSQNTVKAQNIDAARIMGVELNTSIQPLTFLKIIGNYTFMDTKNQSDTPFYRDKALPGRPAHELYAKMELFHDTSKWSASVWTDVSYTGGNYLDPSNMKDAGSRAIIGTGLRISNPRYGLSLTVEIKNLLDTIIVTTMDGYERALQDYEGFPLPGRTIMATLRWKVRDGDDNS